MLEKTAASLEPCGLQRVLPSAHKAFRSRRQLHTTFWHHGAADIEVTGAWHTLMHGTWDLTNMAAQPLVEGARGPALAASTFLLDFLYPSGAIALMRRLNPVLPDRFDTARPPGGLGSLAPRLYTSSAPRSQASKKRQEETNTPSRTPESAVDTLQDDLREQEALDDSESSNRTGESSDHHGMLDELLIKDNPEDSDEVWHHFQALDDPSQEVYLGQVLVFLSKTGRLADSWKISDLFRKIDEARWDGYTFVSGVKSELNLQNNADALDIFVRGLSHERLDLPPLVEALDMLLAQSLRQETPELLRDLWNHYPEMAGYWDFEAITSHLKHVITVPGLAEKAISFHESVSQFILESGDVGVTYESIQCLQKILVRRALFVCADAQVIPLLNITKDTLAYEEFLRQAIPKRRYRLATEIYGTYRDLPGSQPSRAVHYEVFKGYTTMKCRLPFKLAGVEVLWGDWHKYHLKPSQRAYQKYLAFYASLGDKEKVHALWKEYIDLYVEENVLHADDTFAHLLQVHAVLGEVDEVQNIFNDISGRFSLTPNTYCWNILLNAYAKVGDYDGALQTFEKLAATGQPDKYTYGTLMQMTGSRGDLGLTVDLYGRARRGGVRANEAILGGLVDAYCQNDLFKEAEDVCIRAARKKILSTRLWNRLLHYHALRRDLVTINRILDAMATRGIPYNEFTYEQLLLGLALCRQAQHALHLLTVARQDKAFEVTPRHFYIVMGALIKTRDPEPVLSLNRMMKEHGIPITAGIIFRLVQAMGQFREHPKKGMSRQTATHWLGDALRSYYKIYGYQNRFSSVPGRSGTTGSKRTQMLKGGSEPYQFGTMMFMFVELKDIVRAKELVDLYRYVFQGTGEETLPVQMLNAVMLAELREGQFDLVKETWKVLLDTVKVEARSEDYDEELPHTTPISPRYRYVLSGGLKIMQEVFFIQNDAAGLAKLIRDVRDAGFEIDSKNLNYYVQLMSQLKEYREAFKTCEELLMPNWTGWYIARVRESLKHQLPLDLRRQGTSPRYLRPIATTLYRLAQAYVELDRLSPWSADARALLHELGDSCPQAIRAIQSMVRVHSSLEYEIFGDLDSPFAGEDEEEQTMQEGEGEGEGEGDGYPEERRETAEEQEGDIDSPR